jgi:hypothetical protein
MAEQNKLTYMMYDQHEVVDFNMKQPMSILIT